MPSEDLELPFAKYVRGRIARATGGCSPTRCSTVRKRRYLIKYETGSATVRNAQHKTATLGLPPFTNTVAPPCSGLATSKAFIQCSPKSNSLQIVQYRWRKRRLIQFGREV